MKIINLRGNNHYDVFFNLGKKLRQQIKYRNEFRKNKIGNNYAYFCKKALEWYRLVKKFFPEYYLEIKGLEDGSGSKQGEVFLANCSDVFDINETKCTTLVSKIKNNIYICHNEDEIYPDYIKDAYIFNLKIKNKKYFGFGMCRSIIGSSISFSKNVFQFVNTLLPNDVKKGVPRNIISRLILDCQNADEVKEKLKKIPRGSSYHHTIFFVRNKEIFSLEYDNKELSFKLIKKLPFFHTNHYLSKLKKKNKYASKSSLIRYINLRSLSKSIKSKNDLYKIMSNSKNFPYGISRSETIYSAVLNTSLKTIDFSFGRPINLISYKNKIKISL